MIRLRVPGRHRLAALCFSVLMLMRGRAEATTCSDTTEERAQIQAEEAERKLEVAYEDLEKKRSVNVAATSDFVDDPEGAAGKAKQAATALKQAQEDVQSAKKGLEAAQRQVDCLLKKQAWSASVGIPVHVAGGAGGAVLWGTGVRWAVMSTTRSLHQLEANYRQLTNFDFDTASYRREGHALSFGSLAYAYGFQRVRVGMGVASRLSFNAMAPDRRFWLVGRAAVEFGARTPKNCRSGCFIGTGSLLVEPWLPLDGEGPITVVGGVELQFGAGDGPIRD